MAVIASLRCLNINASTFKKNNHYPTPAQKTPHRLTTYPDSFCATLTPAKKILHKNLHTMKNRYRYHLTLYILTSLTLLATHALAKTIPPEQKATDKGIKLYQNQQYSQALPLLKIGSQKGKAAAHYYLARIY